MMQESGFGRRGILSAVAAAISAAVLPRPVMAAGRMAGPDQWRLHFADLSQGAILVDSAARMLHFWSAGDGEHRGFVCSVPASADLTRRGDTRVLRKVEAPIWHASPGMRQLRPGLPARISAGPGNPLGSHALFLDWPYFRVHGTNDPGTVGLATVEGCFGIGNDDIAALFARVKVGMPVRVI